jgi:hypothetical protein
MGPGIDYLLGHGYLCMYCVVATSTEIAIK